MREGLDLPEVALVAILMPIKKVFALRSVLFKLWVGQLAMQKVELFYVDEMTGSLKRAVEETRRRRKVQEEYKSNTE